MHNYCEVSKETGPKQSVELVMNNDQEFQPPTQTSNYETDCNEVGGKS